MKHFVIALLFVVVLTGCTNVVRRRFEAPIPYEDCRKVLYDNFASDNRKISIAQGRIRANYEDYNESVTIVEDNHRTECTATYELSLSLGKKISTFWPYIFWQRDGSRTVEVKLRRVRDKNPEILISDRRCRWLADANSEPPIAALLLEHMKPAK